ncbi:hypothetical protein [Mucilaginibacter sp.]|jgi:hypothetical protein|uniref:hypothetical protein n=1 Tax=Mucilaginibacter sp. TaxID=1882438 RepID=UPI0035629854
MIEVFKTDVTDIAQSRSIINMLTKHIPGGCINFDLEDCDNILRVQSECFSVETVILLLKNMGHYCEPLEN